MVVGLPPVANVMVISFGRTNAWNRRSHRVESGESAGERTFSFNRRPNGPRE